MQNCKRADKYHSEPENISRNPESDLKRKAGPKIRLDFKMCAVIARNETTRCS